MNLLEQYIEEIISEKLIPLDETECRGLTGQYVEVKAVINCYGSKEMINQLFLQEEWEEYKKQGYYMA